MQAIRARPRMGRKRRRPLLNSTITTGPMSTGLRKHGDEERKMGLNDRAHALSYVMLPFQGYSSDIKTPSSSDIKIGCSYDIKTPYSYDIKTPYSYDIKTPCSYDIKIGCSYDITIGCSYDIDIANGVDRIIKLICQKKKIEAKHSRK